MARAESDLNVLRSKEGGRNVRRAEAKKRILAWTTPWYAFFLAFAIVWGNGLLKAATVAPAAYSMVLPATVLVASIVIAACNFDEDGMFDQPIAFTFALGFGAVGTVLVALPRLGISAVPLSVGGFVLSGIAAALLFVLWSEVLARFSVCQALFYLCSDMVFAAILLWFLDHFDSVGGYVAILLCFVACCVGVHRAWESFRGTAGLHDGRFPVSEQAGDERDLGPLSEQDDETVAPHGRSHLPLGIFVALFVYVVTVILLKSLGNNAPMGYVSYGMAFGPLLMLIMILKAPRLPLSMLYEAALVLALLGFLAQPLFGHVGNIVGIIASDAVLGLVILLLASVNIIVVQRYAYSISRFAAVGAVLLTAAITLGCVLGEVVRSVFPWGTGLPALTGCLFTVVIATIACLSGNRHFSFDISLAADIAAAHASTAAASGTSLSQKSAVSASVPAFEEEPVDERRSPMPVEASSAETNSKEALANDSFFGGDPRDVLCRKVRIIAEDKGLHEREAEVLLLLVMGMTSAEAAGELCIALGTVKAHTHNVYAKLGVHSRDELRAYVSSYDYVN